MTKKKDKKKQMNWKEVARGGIIPEGGTSLEYKTGDWRTFKPVWLPDKCIHCLACWMFCPEGAIMVKDGKVVGINYDYCKGCGICAKECLAKEKAIEMIIEEKGDKKKEDK